MYDFNLIKGQSFTLKGYPTSGTVTIDSSAIVIKNGVTLKYQRYRYSSVSHTFEGEVFEGIGNTAFFFPIGDGATVIGLRCYEDSIMNLVKFSTDDCDKISGIDSYDGVPNVVISPNPFANFIIVTGDVDALELQSFTGEILFTYSTNDSRIDTKSLAPGIYILKLQSNKQIIYKRIVKPL